MRERLAAGRLVLRYVFRADPVRAWASLVVSVVASVSDMLGAVVLKLVTDAAFKGDAGELAWCLVLLAGTLLGAVTAHWASITLGMALRERATLFFDSRMAELAAGIHHIEHHERPDYLDELQVLHQNHQKLAAVQNAVVFHLGTVCRLVVSVALLTRLHPALVLLPLAGVPSLLAGFRVERQRHRLNDDIAADRRMGLRLFELATNRDAGKELRVFGAGPMVLDRYLAAETAADRTSDRVDIQAAVLNGLAWVFFALAFCASLLLVARQAVAGRATPGDVVLALTLARSVNYGVSNLRNSVSWLLDNLNTGKRLLWLERLAAEAAAAARPSSPSAVPTRLASGIHVEGVSFRYPGTTADVLRDVDLMLPAGSTVAIVGDNGAGKTTLVKLLCRMYDATAGRVTVDGTDLRSYDVDEWRTRLSGCFQDFARLELVARESVGVGDVARAGDEAAVVTALDRAHAAELPAGLPDGLATQLGRSFDGGVEPSTGQWQKVALGRAMMRDAPLLLLLDEPTASLDPVTEAALFERYAGAAARTAAANGAITVLVSHRFSTVRMADLIVVLRDGRVVETGSHDELVGRSGGVYAELYGLQARLFAPG